MKAEGEEGGCVSELDHKFPQITHGPESSTGVTSPCQAGQVPGSSHLNLILPQHSSRFNKSSISGQGTGLSSHSPVVSIQGLAHTWPASSRAAPTSAGAPSPKTSGAFQTLQWGFDYKQDFFFFFIRKSWELVLQTSFIVLNWRFYHQHLRLGEGKKNPRRFAKPFPLCCESQV